MRSGPRWMGAALTLSAACRTGEVARTDENAAGQAGDEAAIDDAGALTSKAAPVQDVQPSSSAASSSAAASSPAPSIDASIAAAEAIASGRALNERGEFLGALQACGWAIAVAEHERAARDCATVAYGGRGDFEGMKRVFTCDDSDDDGHACDIAVAKLLLAENQAFAAAQVLNAVLFDDEEHGPTMALQESVLKRVREQVTTQAMLATGGEYVAARAVAPTAFATELRAQILAGSAELGDLVHPDLGVFVVHNIPGSQAHLERVRTWPEGEYEYAAYVDAKAIDKMKRAQTWRPGIRVREDDAGCEHVRDTVVVADDTVFDGYFIQFGNEGWVVPEEPWLVPIDEVEDYLDAARGLDPTHYEPMRTAALAITHSVYVSDARFDFGRLDGRWYWLALDIQEDFCG